MIAFVARLRYQCNHRENQLLKNWTRALKSTVLFKYECVSNAVQIFLEYYTKITRRQGWNNVELKWLEFRLNTTLRKLSDSRARSPFGFCNILAPPRVARSTFRRCLDEFGKFRWFDTASCRPDHLSSLNFNFFLCVQGKTIDTIELLAKLVKFV